MSEIISSDEIGRLANLSDDELFEGLGKSLENSAVECLNKALAIHGGTALIDDGTSHQMTEYVDDSKVNDVLNDAKQLAEQRNIVVNLNTMGIESVVTDDDAILFVLGA